MSLLTEPEFPPHLVCLKDIDTLLRCPICFDYLNISMMTKCSHNFCSLCIRKFLSYKLQCPVCNLAMTEQDLRNNRILDDLVMSFQAARQQLLQINLDSPSVSPKSLRPRAKRKAPSASRPIVESPIMKNFLQKGNSPSFSSAPSSSSSSKPHCSSKNLRLDPSNLIRSVKVELVPLPVQLSGTLKKRLVEKPVEATRTVKDERMKVSAPLARTAEERVGEGTRAVKEEMVEKALTGSLSGLSSGSESPSTSQSAKAVLKVECPVCSVGIAENQINSHLDSCLSRDEKKESLRSSAKKRKPLTKLVYNLLTIQELRKRLRDLNLPTKGSREQLVRRHQEYLLMYNAECDSISPKSAQEIAKEVEINEKMRAQLQSKCKSALVISKNQTEEEIDRLHSNYRRQHSAEFSRLIDQVRGHREASKKADSNEAQSGGGGGAERGHPGGKPGDTAPCALKLSSEDPAAERLLNTEDSERCPSPSFSDISVSSSISDVFSMEADGNTQM
ncbi:hypothetical protein GJAV_G00173480 [Gymnothorax javanicus]|nr:hypothetical protein GJAV_G00173480 [Gymnothorax javanicus]